MRRPDDGRQAGDRQRARRRRSSLRRRGVARLGHEHERADAAQTTTTGRLTRKIAAPVEVLDQPAAGDRADGDAEPDTAAQMAIAFGRSCAGKMLVRIDSVVGMIAGGADAHQRARRDQLGRAARTSAASSEPVAEDDAGRRPARGGGRSGRRGCRRRAAGPRRRAGSRRRSTAAGSSSRRARRWIVGSATLRIVLPTVTTSRLSARTTSACQRRAYGGLVVDICMLPRGGWGIGWTRD